MSVAGWKIVSITQAEGSTVPIEDWLLVAIPDRDGAISAVKKTFPDAELRVDSEADAADLAKYDVSDGAVFVLVEGS